MISSKYNVVRRAKEWRPRLTSRHWTLSLETMRWFSVHLPLINMWLRVVRTENRKVARLIAQLSHRIGHTHRMGGDRCHLSPLGYQLQRITLEGRGQSSGHAYIIRRRVTGQRQEVIKEKRRRFLSTDHLHPLRVCVRDRIDFHARASKSLVMEGEEICLHGVYVIR